MWDAVAGLGFTGGKVLEPGCGSGNFIAARPNGVKVTGVELDPTTAAIAQARCKYNTKIITGSFADVRLPDDHFDLTIGNVPFAKVTLHDPRHNKGRHSIHNHFIIKSLHLTRPGGLVAVLTSRYTLDSQDDAARREMHALADLVTAIRLPTDAHLRTAGTRVVMDMLIFRRREADRAPAPGAVADRRPRSSSTASRSRSTTGYWGAQGGVVLGNDDGRCTAPTGPVTCPSKLTATGSTN